MIENGQIDGYTDAALGLPCQPANRFATYHVLRDGADWRAYADAYVATYHKTSRERR